MRGTVRALAIGLMCAGVTGCHHKVPPPVLPVPPPATVPLEPAPEPKTPPQLAQVPTQPVPLPTVIPPAKKTKKVKKPVAPAPAPTAAPAPVQVASSGLPPTPNVIGALTPGDASPGMSQQAAELIASLDKRMAGLPAEFKDKQRDGLAKVVNFEKQAQTALKAGDADGAFTLATKAKVLLDDLTK